MPTECNRDLFGFAPVEGREVVASFDGGAITSDAGALLLGATDRGTLEPGKRADFLVLSGNPLDDVRNTRQLVSVWHGGREIQPAVTSANAR